VSASTPRGPLRAGPFRNLSVTLSVPAALAAVLLYACSSAPAANAPAGSAPDAARGPAPKAAARPAEPGRFDSAWASVPASELPFPDARDTLGWDLSALPDAGTPADTSRATARNLPGAPVLPPVSRPEGIRQRPRPKDLPERVHVLLTRSSKPFSLYSLGDMQVVAELPGEGGKAPALSRLARVKGRFVVRRAGAGFEVEQGGKVVASTPARRLRIISVNPYNLIDLGTGVYRGGMHLLAGSGSEVAAVNVLGVEDYLRGVLPYELGNVNREGLEALKAQAIVARTYAYKRMLNGANADFHLYSDVQDQVYKGVRGEYLMADRAVWETRGMAVVHGDSLALCYYFSTCGGRTASKHEVWGGDSIPYLVSRPDTDAVGEAWCQASKYMAWSQEWTQPQLAGILKRNLRSAGVADFPAFTGVSAIAVSQRATCGRARLLAIQTNRGPITVKGDKTRWALRPPGTEEKILPSAWFTVKASGGKIIAQGKGFGHGVGLCQMGALGRAKANQNFVQIIRAYYQGVDVAEFR
jgi:stage II sporulation protein D